MARRGVVLVVLAALAGAVRGTEEPIAGRIAMRQGRTASKLVLVARAGIVAPLPGGSEDPTLHGATLDIENPRTGERAELLAPAAGWSVNPLGTVFRYRAGKRDAAPGIRFLVIRHGSLLKVKASAVGITLDEPAQGVLTTSLTTGTRRYCLLFGGDVRRDEPGRFVARNAPAPAACPDATAAPPTTTSTRPAPVASTTTTTVPRTTTTTTLAARDPVTTTSTTLAAGDPVASTTSTTRPPATTSTTSTVPPTSTTRIVTTTSTSTSTTRPPKKHDDEHGHG